MTLEKLWKKHAGPSALGLFFAGALSGYVLGRAEANRPLEPVQEASTIALPLRVAQPAVAPRSAAPNRKTPVRKAAARKAAPVQEARQEENLHNYLDDQYRYEDRHFIR